MLPPDGQSDRFLKTKEMKLVGCRSGKFVFPYIVQPAHLTAIYRSF